MIRIWKWFWALKWYQRFLVATASWGAFFVAVMLVAVVVAASRVTEETSGTGVEPADPLTDTWVDSDDVFKCGESQSFAKVWIENDSLYMKSYKFEVKIYDKDDFLVEQYDGDKQDLPPGGKTIDDVGAFAWWSDDYDRCEVVEQEEKREE